MVPNTAGSGYDTTARAAAKVMDDTKITSNIEVFNLAGAGGTVGLARTVSEKGNGKLIMMMGLGVVGAQYTNKSEAKLDQTTPIAKLIEESGAIVVAKDSPYKTITSWWTPGRPTRRAWPSAAAQRRAGRITCCRCSSLRPSGSSPKEVNFISYDGGGDLLPAVLGGKVAFAPSGSASSSTRSRPVRYACWRSAGRSGWPQSTRRR